MAEANDQTVPEPYPGYAEATADEVIKHVREDGREASELATIRAAEEAREGSPRATVIKALDAVEAEQDSREQRYSRDELLSRARPLLSVSRHAAAGALHDLGDQRITLGEANKRVADFTSRPATTDEDDA